MTRVALLVAFSAVVLGVNAFAAERLAARAPSFPGENVEARDVSESMFLRRETLAHQATRIVCPSCLDSRFNQPASTQRLDTRLLVAAAVAAPRPRPRPPVAVAARRGRTVTATIRRAIFAGLILDF